MLWAYLISGPNTAASIAPTLIRHWYHTWCVYMVLKDREMRWTVTAMDVLLFVDRK